LFDEKKTGGKKNLVTRSLETKSGSLFVVNKQAYMQLYDPISALPTRAGSLINSLFPWGSFLLQAVLPGPEEASPPIEQKNTAIWRNHTANSNFQKFRYFSATPVVFLHSN
jgi:hypothetical protein